MWAALFSPREQNQTAEGLVATDEKSIKREVMDEIIHCLHYIFPKGKAVRNFSNSNVYMTVVRSLTRSGQR